MMDHNQLRDYIHRFRLDNCARGNQGYNRVILQVFGFTGDGKSAFINSCKYALDGEYRTIAEAGEQHGGLTMVRRSYKLTDTITIVDNRGYYQMSGFQALEVYAQLGSFLPLNVNVRWKQDYDHFMEELDNADLDPHFTDLIVPVCVYNIRHSILVMDQDEIKTFLKTCLEMTGIPPIVVLSFKASGQYLKVEEWFRSLGAETVFAVENYTEEDHVATRGRHTDMLNIMKSAIEDVKLCMESEKNPRRERVERKFKLLRLASRTDQERRKDESHVTQRKEEEKSCSVS